MTDTAFSVLATLVVLVHVAFVVFVALGGLLVLRMTWVAWLHLPAVAWAVFVELSGRLCPLTPLENVFRRLAGLDVYQGDFVARYVFPLLYPEGLTRGVQVAIGLGVLLVNACVYTLVLVRSRTASR